MKQWHKIALQLAGYYNMLYGAWILIFPFAFFRLTGLPDPVYPVIWQSVGMIVGVYGLGYLIAAQDPVRHWPIILVGWLGKIFGPVGFVFYALQDKIEWIFGLNILTNDIIWWVPFTLILLAVFRESQKSEKTGNTKSWQQLLNSSGFNSFHNQNIAKIQSEEPVVMLFLRHFGCTFCKETLSGLAKNYQHLQGKVKIILVHMSACERAEGYFRQFNLNGIDHVSDPDGVLYQTFKLDRGNYAQMFGWKEIKQGVRAFLRNGYLPGKLEGDGFRLSGIFLINDFKILAEKTTTRASDVIDVNHFIEKHYPESAFSKV
ncbi:MAG: hypothetical protein ACNS62_12190 [Candidatus Cyclobacteriaceae bacterium M3_2C_046]